jgi:hypothetical protein
MVKKELYETLNEEQFTLSIGTMTGKLILESLDSIRAYGNTSTNTLQLVLSVLETANT